MKAIHWLCENGRTMCGIEATTKHRHNVTYKQKDAVTCQRCLAGLRRVWDQDRERRKDHD